MKINYSMKEISRKKSEQLNEKSIKELIRKEFIDSCERILIENQTEFIGSYFNKIILILKNLYGNDIFKKISTLNKNLEEIKTKFINDIYNPMHELCSLCLKYYNSKERMNIDNYKISYLHNFRPHCMSLNNNQDKLKNNTNALHVCGGKLLIISKNLDENNVNMRKYSYIICSKCKKCYFPKSIPMLCCHCLSFYYSETVPENIIKNNCYLATWAKYHCKNMYNEKMSCIKCGKDFWLKNNKLYCKNCKFEIEPNEIIWTCVICNKDFNSDAKIYNPLEFKEAKLILKESFIYKRIAKPFILPCKCVEQNKISQINFYHKNKNNKDGECKGILYYCQINGKRFIVCSLCFNIYYINNFRWNCPICNKSFKTMKVRIYKKLNCSKDKYKNNINNNNLGIRHIKSKSFKNSSRRKDYPETIFNSNNSYNNHINKYGLNSFHKRNIKSYLKKLPNNKQRTSSGFLPSIKDLKVNKSNINITENNKSFKVKSDYLFNINNRKRRNLSEIPNEVKNDFYFSILKMGKPEHRYNSGTGSTIFSSFSNYNNNSQKEAIIKTILEPSPTIKYNNNKKIILNSLDNNNTLSNNSNLNKYQYGTNFNRKKKYHNIDIDTDIDIDVNYDEPSNLNQKLFKNNNLISNSVTYFSNENISQKNTNKINNNYISPKNLKRIIHSNNLNIFKKINKDRTLEQILNKDNSFYIKDKNYILFSQENESKDNKTIFNSKKSVRLKDTNLEFKQLIPNNKLNKEKYRNNLNKNSSKKHIINNSYMNELTISNNNSIYNIIYKNNSMTKENSLKRNKTSSFEKNLKSKMQKDKIKKNKSIKNNNNIIYINNSICKNNNNNKKLIPKEKKNAILNKRKNIDANSKLKNKRNNSNTIKNNSSDKWNRKLSQFNFNEYTIITQLGQGSFGKIYLVKDSKGNIYSMKKILLSEELDVKAVIDEYNMCYNLNHPNIVKILGIYSNKLDKTTFVVYVLMEVGISDWEKEIKSYRTKKILYKEQELIDILKQLISSLSFLQKNHISHRDIKPQNILIFKNKVYKLTDFGEARRIGGKDENNNDILQYSLKGTELYMSPLLFNGLRTGQIDIKHNTYKSDVYSLGLCLLYAASTRDKTLFEIRRIIEMPKVRKYVELHLKNKFSDKLINIIVSMLEIHEQNRPDFIELEKIIGSY